MGISQSGYTSFMTFRSTDSLSTSCQNSQPGGTVPNTFGSVSNILRRTSTNLTPRADYPHWDMLPGLKYYELTQAAYWCQQLIVLVLGLEKPRKDYKELVAHHIVTLWLIGCVKLPITTLIKI